MRYIIFAVSLAFAAVLIYADIKYIPLCRNAYLRPVEQRDSVKSAVYIPPDNWFRGDRWCSDPNVLTGRR